MKDYEKIWKRTIKNSIKTAIKNALKEESYELEGTNQMIITGPDFKINVERNITKWDAWWNATWFRIECYKDREIQHR
jgi:hypothetical protein